MKMLYLYFGIGISIFVFSCSDAQNNSSHVLKADTPDSDFIAQNIAPVASHYPAFDTLSKLIQYYNHILDSFFKIKREIFKNKPGLTKDLLQPLDSSLYATQQEKNTAIYNYIIVHEKNSESLEGIKYLVLDRKMHITLVDYAFKNFPPAQRNSTIGKWLSAKIEERKKAELISSYDLSLLDIAFETAHGIQLSLGQLPSKYILLDFWASWCAPCRYENRRLVEEKESTINGVDITIIAVSADVNKERWLRAVKEDGLNYTSICDYKALESPVAKAFKINSIPFNVIVTKDGKVLASNLWGNKLKEFINTLN